MCIQGNRPIIDCYIEDIVAEEQILPGHSSPGTQLQITRNNNQ